MNKKIIGLVIFLGFLFLLFVLIMMNRDSTSYILIDGITKIKYSKGYKKEENLHFFLNDPMTIYGENGLIGEYKIEESSDGFLKYTNFMLGNQYLAVSSSASYQVAQFEVTELDEENLSILKEVLDSYGIEKYASLTSNQQIIYDIDKDGTAETIISVSNYSLENNDTKQFNFVYIVKNGKVFYLVDEVYLKSEKRFLGKYKIEYLLAFKKNKYDIILYYSDWDINSHKIYRQEQNEFKLVFES